MITSTPFTNPGTPWLGKTVVCLGSGYSLGGTDWLKLILMQLENGVKILSVNSSIKTSRLGGVEPDAIIFTDNNWYEDNEKLIKDFKGMKFTLSRRAKEAYPDLIRLDNIHKSNFSVGDGVLRDGRSTGHRAVSLAILCGGKKVVLLGYDMQIDPVSGRSHCHDDYQMTENDKSYRNEFLPSFVGWNQDAREIGVEIINCTPGSALKEFPCVRFSDLDV